MGSGGGPALAVAEAPMWIQFLQGTHQGAAKLTLTSDEHQERGVCFAHAHVFRVNHPNLLESSQN